jgi:hypothetical protein
VWNLNLVEAFVQFVSPAVAGFAAAYSTLPENALGSRAYLTIPRIGNRAAINITFQVEV